MGGKNGGGAGRPRCLLRRGTPLGKGAPELRCMSVAAHGLAWGDRRGVPSPDRSHRSPPIWRQIEEQVRQLVGAGVVAPTAPLPSVRDLARALRVNPATVAKANQRLCEQGVLEVRRGKGTFVAVNVPRQDEARRRELLAGAARRFICAGEFPSVFFRPGDLSHDRQAPAVSCSGWGRRWGRPPPTRGAGPTGPPPRPPSGRAAGRRAGGGDGWPGGRAG